LRYRKVRQGNVPESHFHRVWGILARKTPSLVSTTGQSEEFIENEFSILFGDEEYKASQNNWRRNEQLQRQKEQEHEYYMAMAQAQHIRDIEIHRKNQEAEEKQYEFYANDRFISSEEEYYRNNKNQLQKKTKKTKQKHMRFSQKKKGRLFYANLHSKIKDE
jgi:hypothetical protein